MAVAYSIFVGIGAISASLLGYYVFGERINLMQIACIALILGGIAGLKGGHYCKRIYKEQTLYYHKSFRG